MPVIGKVVVGIEAQYAAFSKGIEHVQESLHSLGETAESIKGILEGALSFAGVEVGVESIKGMVENTVAATTEAYRLSGALGITTGSLQSLQTAGLLGAGLSADEFDNTLRKLAKTLGGAEEGNLKTADALSKVGLSMKDLSGLGVDQAFTRIAEAMSKTTDVGARNAAVTALFGREGQKLLPLFQEGAEGIRAASDEASKLGVALSDADAAKVVAAHEELAKVGLAVQGLENQFVVALAPALTAIGDQLTSLVPSADAMRDAFVTAFRYGAEAVGVVEDAFNVLRLAGQGLTYVLVSGFEAVVQAMEFVAEGVDKVAGLFGVDLGNAAFFRSIEAGAESVRGDLEESMGKTVRQLEHPNSTRWGHFFDQIQDSAAAAAAKMADKKHSLAAPLTADMEEGGKKVESILAGLQQQVDTFGLSEGMKKVAELKLAGGSAADVAKAEALAKQLDTLEKQKKVTEDLNKLAVEAAQAGMTAAQKKVDDLQRAGASGDQLAQAKGLQDQIDKMAAWRKEQEDANKLIEHSMTPIEKYQEQIDKVQKLFQDGLITAQQQGDAIEKAQEELAKDDKDGGDAKGSAAVTRRFDFTLPVQPQVQTAQERAAELMRDHLAELRKLNQQQKPIYDFYNNPANTTPDVIFDV